jgi:hypothetical protein
MTITITDLSEVRTGDLLTLRHEDGAITATGPAGGTRARRCIHGMGAILNTEGGDWGRWTFVSATREVPEYAPGQTGTATVRGVEAVRVMRMDASERAWTSPVPVRGDHRHSESDVTSFVPDRAPRPLPLNGTVMVVLGSHELKDNGECLCGRLVSGHPYDIHVANDLIRLFAGPDLGHGDNCSDPGCDC